MTAFESPPPIYHIFFGIGLGGMVLMLFVLSYSNRRLASPLLVVLQRWLRWFVFSLLMALLLKHFELSSRPFPVLIIVAGLVWFLIETVYNWVAISLINKSGIPIFPRFVKGGPVDAAAAAKKLGGLHQHLGTQEYSLVQRLTTVIGSDLRLECFIYNDARALIRVQVLLIPQPFDGVPFKCVILASQTASGLLYITDNVFFSYGGFYPGNYRLLRRPWLRSFKRLMRWHHHRIEKERLSLVQWGKDPLAELNQQQQIIERFNIEKGFLAPKHLQEERGSLTLEGRYRLWKAFWLMNYLGF